MPSIDSLKQYATELGCAFTQDEPMNRHTTFKIGGTADICLAPSNAKMLGCIVAACKKWGIPYHLIGNGSNVLVADSGVRGAVIMTGGLADITLTDAYTIECSAGVKTSQLCMFALEHSLGGFEFLWGIPGTVGGAVVMNAGAYGGEINDVIVAAQQINEQGDFEWLEKDALQLGYRRSIFSENGGIVTAARFRGEAQRSELIREKMDDLMSRRKQKQPLEYPSAGSTFKRPPDGYAAELIDRCGLAGRTVGGAQVSTKHTGFVINLGNATASDVKILIEQIKQEVFLQTDTQLECEIRMVE